MCQAVAVNRHAVVAQSHLGEVLSSLRLRNDAISAWRAALSMQPRHVPSLLAIADELRRSGAYGSAAWFHAAAILFSISAGSASGWPSRRGLA